MINRIRNTVLFMLNKENRGFITPSEFNNKLDFAQMQIFEDDFHAYSKAIVKQNARLYNNGYSDIPKHLRERVDIFTEYGGMTYDSNSNLWTLSNSDFYRLQNISYEGNDVEEVSKLELNRVLKNSLIKPTKEYPVYVKVGSEYRTYPDLSDEGIEALYVRRPKEPKWTYIEVGGNPLFNPSANDFQDVELHGSCEMELIIKVLMACGMSIRETDVIQATQDMDVVEKQNQGI